MNEDNIGKQDIFPKITMKCPSNVVTDYNECKAENMYQNTQITG